MPSAREDETMSNDRVTRVERIRAEVTKRTEDVKRRAACDTAIEALTGIRDAVNASGAPYLYSGATITRDVATTAAAEIGELHSMLLETLNDLPFPSAPAFECAPDAERVCAPAGEELPL